MDKPVVVGPPVEISLRTALSRAGLVALRHRIDDMLEGFPDISPAPAAGTEAELSDAKANAAWDRLGENTRKYLMACAVLAIRVESFTIEDVAAELGQERARVLALHRNVMRTAGIAEPRSVALITSTRSGGRTHLSMSEAVSRAVLDLSTQGRDAP